MAINLNLSDSKIVWTDKDKGILLVWKGGREIKSYKVKELEELGTYFIDDPIHPDFPSFTQVKKKMRRLINGIEEKKK